MYIFYRGILRLRSQHICAGIFAFHKNISETKVLYGS